MKAFHLMLVPGLVVAWLVNSPGNAKEPDPTVNSVLAKWEEASRQCKTLDAKLTVWKYDPVFEPNKPTVTYGRFYYESPNLGRYEIRKTAKGATNDWPSISEAIIWTGKETLWIDGPHRRCTKYPTAKIQAYLSRDHSDKNDPSKCARRELSQPERKDLGWLSEIFSAFFRQLARILQGPEQTLPLMIGIRANEIRERFHVTVDQRGEEIHLRAIPKQSTDAACYSKIDVILNAKTYMTVATQVFSPNGRDRTVFELSEPKVNQRPSDRDQLLAPDLSWLRVTEEDFGVIADAGLAADSANGNPAPLGNVSRRQPPPVSHPGGR